MGRGCRWSQGAPRLPGTRTSPAPCWTRSSLTHAKGLMPPIVWIDGTYHDRSDAKVSVFDHGLLYGDGVFEGIRVYNRRVVRLGQHIDRLYASAKGIWLEIPLDVLRSEEHTSELQSLAYLVCRLLLEKKKNQ